MNMPMYVLDSAQFTHPKMLRNSCSTLEIYTAAIGGESTLPGGP